MSLFFSFLRCLFFFFFFNDTATTEIYTLSLHDALPIYGTAIPEFHRPTLPPGDFWTVHVEYHGPIAQDPVRSVRAVLDAANRAGVERVVLELNTDGGNVNAGYEFARAIESSKAPVACVVDGSARSMGFFILQACRVRLATPRSILMVHEPLYVNGMEGKTEVDFRNLANGLHNTAEAMLRF